ncbi:hypothetical protein CCYA_CCYA13G3439 [Cyanidiococcus yangmingshanensis]|nr:hypothetical protein CCYA_CCYA13G3439 [Cyanidiococcus yangmingshanensis]
MVPNLNIVVRNALLVLSCRRERESIVRYLFNARRRQLRASNSSASTSGETPPTEHSSSEPPVQRKSVSQEQHPFRYAVATILERTPIILPEPTPEERAFRRFRLLMANAQARELPPEVFELLSQSGRPKQNAEMDPKRSELFELDEGEYEPAPRETEADRTDNRHSLDRKLDRWLFLLVQRKLGPAGRAIWQFPQRNIEDGRRNLDVESPSPKGSTPSSLSFRAEAEKALYSFIETSKEDEDEGESFEAHFIGNAPCAHLKHTYSPAFQKAQHIAGVKVFFYRAQLISGQITGVRPPAAEDYAWVTADELPEYLPPEYYRAIAPVVW